MEKTGTGGGLLDNLINKGTLPKVEVEITTGTLVSLGITIVLAAVIVLLINAIIKKVL